MRNRDGSLPSNNEEKPKKGTSNSSDFTSPDSDSDKTGKDDDADETLKKDRSSTFEIDPDSTGIDTKADKTKPENFPERPKG